MQIKVFDSWSRGKNLRPKKPRRERKCNTTRIYQKGETFLKAHLPMAEFILKMGYMYSVMTLL